MTMSPPGKSEEGKADAAGRTYYQGLYGSRRPESGSEDHQAVSDSHESRYWEAWGPNRRDSYGYSGYKPDYDDGYYQPTQRFLEARSGHCGPQVPGYKLALQDDSFALGLFVVGAFATYLLWQQIQAGAGTGGRADTFLDGFWSGKK